MKKYFIYILCSERNGTLYIGVTNNLARRMYEHQQLLVPGFTQKYNIKKLVHVEQYSTAYQAISREKKLKDWNRSWKIKLIEENNIEWKDLSEYLL
ncbi:GIY-YIG nuclease family protein [Candidatus Babeliales bacterium]|nr:GIY-YIG nuclease family protein [Candidatus Babeliales bacterium]